MKLKIEIIQEGALWHWVILEYDINSNQWFNAMCGVKMSYMDACLEAKQEYDRMKKNLINWR